MDRSDFIAEIENRLTKLFRASKAGYRIADVERHRLEGFIHAGIFLGLYTIPDMQRLMEQVHLSVFGQTIDERKSARTAAWPGPELDYSRFDIPPWMR